MTTTTEAPPAPAPANAPPAPTTDKKKRTRAKPEYLVERLNEDDSWIQEKRAPTGGFTDTAAGKKWIRDNGEDGMTYRVARITFGPVKVHTQTLTKRVLQ